MKAMRAAPGESLRSRQARRASLATESFAPCSIGQSFRMHSAARSAEVITRILPGWLVMILTALNSRSSIGPERRTKGLGSVGLGSHLVLIRTIPPSLGQQFFHRPTDPSQGISQAPSVLHSQIALKVFAIRHIAPCVSQHTALCSRNQGQSTSQTMPNANPQPEAHWGKHWESRLGM